MLVAADSHDGDRGTAFSRVSAFRTGFFRGASACQSERHCSPPTGAHTTRNRRQQTMLYEGRVVSGHATIEPASGERLYGSTDAGSVAWSARTTAARTGS